MKLGQNIVFLLKVERLGGLDLYEGNSLILTSYCHLALSSVCCFLGHAIVLLHMSGDFLYSS